MPPDVAYQIIHDELMLDGNARLNLATFVSTWMEPQAEKLMAECFDKNMIDKDEYPQTAELEVRCVNILSRLWHAPDADEATGCSTTGSSEAAMLGGLALKRRWQQRRAADGQADGQAQPGHGHQRPGLLGEVRQLLGRRDAPRADGGRPLQPLGRGGRRSAATRTRSASSRSSARRSTARTSRSRRSATRSTHSSRRRASTSRSTSTARQAPSSRRSSTPTWSGTSGSRGSRRSTRPGHKYGLVYPGVGWIVWRDADALPDDLIFWVNYLGDNMPTFALNFSRPGAQVVAQYYNFLRLGFEGYRRVQAYARDVATRAVGADRRARARSSCSPTATSCRCSPSR